MTTWDIKVLLLNHNLSCFCYWLLHIDVWNDTFHLWCLCLPLLAYYHWTSTSNSSSHFISSGTRANPGGDKKYAECLELVSVMSSIVRLLTNSFLSGNYFSLNFFQISIWINIFPQHQTKIIEVSITRYIGVMDGLKSISPIYVKLSLIICIAVYARKC